MLGLPLDKSLTVEELLPGKYQRPAAKYLFIDISLFFILKRMCIFI